MNWKNYTLGDCVNLLSGGTPSKSKAEYWDGTIPWVSCKDMKVDYLYNSQDHLTDIGAVNGTRLVPPGTILIVVRGMILAQHFPVAIIKRTVAFNQDLKALECSPKVEPQFLFHWLRGKSYEVLGLADEAAHGTKRLQTDRLKNLPLHLPPLPTQKKIAGILSAYDDLIENNTRRIKILEEMAQTLYHEWFVKFRFPGHEHTKMVDSELGLIPERWEVKKLGDVIQFTNGKAIKALEVGNYPVYGSNSIMGWTDKAKYTNGIVIGRVGAYCGSLVYSKFGFWASDNTIVAESSNQKFGIELSFFVLQDLNLRRYAGGSAQPLLTQTVIKEIPVIIPDIATHKRFQTILQNIWAFKINLLNKNSNLRKTRDLLLPKLISGEIDVEHLEITTEDIAA